MNFLYRLKNFLDDFFSTNYGCIISIMLACIVGTYVFVDICRLAFYYKAQNTERTLQLMQEYNIDSTEKLERIVKLDSYSSSNNTDESNCQLEQVGSLSLVTGRIYIYRDTVTGWEYFINHNGEFCARAGDY